MTLDFLLEIGVEEIPDWMIQRACAQLNEHLTDVFLRQHLVRYENVRVDATPRRLAFRAENLPDTQPSRSEPIQGPPVSIGMRGEEFTHASLAFARKLGLTPNDLFISTAKGKGEYVAANKVIPGRRTVDILAEELPQIILGIHWPKTMYWTGKGGPRFIRPIRWVVALLGNEVVPFELAGVTSGNTTCGHRRLGDANVAVTIANYEETLAKNFVLLRADDRRQRIQDGIQALLAGRDLQVKTDAGLLEALVFLTEYPTPILGEFDPSYLTLPEEVLVTVMRHHQKYFSVEKPDGTLAPHFIAVMNIAGDAEGLVRRGNERVLRARFNDARFFWDVDQHKTLSARVSDLEHVTFQAKLGSYLAKAQRTMALARELGGGDAAVRAAELSKCDLTTELVKEFTELQGVVGGLYARAQGEPEAVARAIYEHYKPVSMEDSIPTTAAGRLVSLADKLDTLRGCFRIGMAPSGSSDPFALRRAAQGAVKILVEGNLPLPLAQLTGGDAQLTEFFRDRIDYYFREVRGYPYDEVRAAMAAGFGNLPDLERRLEALHIVRPTGNFEPVAASFKRIKNILRQAGFPEGSVDERLLEAGPERDLYDAVARVAGENLAGIASLRPVVDRYFDQVLVNAPDPLVRANRLAFLAQLLEKFSSVADFSEIVTSGLG
jgi:glycyl-tRNA synthetase beta chain